MLIRMNGTGKYRTKRRITEKFAVCTEEGGKFPSFFVARYAIKQSGDCFERTGIRRDISICMSVKGKEYIWLIYLLMFRRK